MLTIVLTILLIGYALGIAFWMYVLPVLNHRKWPSASEVLISLLWGPAILALTFAHFKYKASK